MAIMDKYDYRNARIYYRPFLQLVIANFDLYLNLGNDEFSRRAKYLQVPPAANAWHQTKSENGRTVPCTSLMAELFTHSCLFASLPEPEEYWYRAFDYILKGRQALLPEDRMILIKVLLFGKQAGSGPKYDVVSSVEQSLARLRQETRHIKELRRAYSGLKV